MRSISMSRKYKKYSKEFKLQAVRECEEGATFYSVDKKYGLSFGTTGKWFAYYKAQGEDALEKHNSMLCRYSAEFKRKVVDDYLSGGGSYQTIAIKYGILSEPTVMKWVRKYNSHEELTVSRPEGVYLVAKENKGRATTLEERIAIVEHCTANSYNYSLTAKEYNCSYSQVYSWVKKYQANGVEGLYDRRGHSKPTEDLSEIEKLRAENRVLKALNKQKQIEIDFLKKLDAVERR